MTETEPQSRSTRPCLSSAWRSASTPLALRFSGTRPARRAPPSSAQPSRWSRRPGSASWCEPPSIAAAPLEGPRSRGVARHSRLLVPVDAHEPAAELGPGRVDRAASPDQELAPTVDDEAVRPPERELEPLRAEGLEPLVLRPGERHARERSAAHATAGRAPGVVVDRGLSEHAPPSRAREPRPRRHRPSGTRRAKDSTSRASCRYPHARPPRRRAGEPPRIACLATLDPSGRRRVRHHPARSKLPVCPGVTTSPRRSARQISRARSGGYGR